MSRKAVAPAALPPIWYSSGLRNPIGSCPPIACRWLAKATTAATCGLDALVPPKAYQSGGFQFGKTLI